MRWIAPGLVAVLLLVVGSGWARLRMETDILGLLPGEATGVGALRTWEEHFSSAHELRITISAATPEAATSAARAVAERLEDSASVGKVFWQPLWKSDSAGVADWIAWQWMNGDPEALRRLSERLGADQVTGTLAEALETLRFSLAPDEIARLAYDPLGLIRVGSAEGGLDPEAGERLFVSEDGRFRVVMVSPAGELRGFEEADRWVREIRREVAEASATSEELASARVRFTGGPAIAAETARQMESDMTGSVAGTGLIVAALFAWAHRRIVPLLWLMTLLGLVLVVTLGLAGWVLGMLNVVSLGFAAILLGLAVDYGLVLQQEAMARPDDTLRMIRITQMRPILFSSGTTAIAFVILAFAGVPGMAQLGVLTAMGSVVAAAMFLSVYLQSWVRRGGVHVASGPPSIAGAGRHSRITRIGSAMVAGVLALIVWTAPPRFDVSTAPLQPLESESQSALEEMQSRLGADEHPVLLVFEAADDGDMARRLARAGDILREWQREGRLKAFQLPDALWPRPESWRENRAAARALSQRAPEILEAMVAAGFAESGLTLAREVFRAWSQLADQAEPGPPPGALGEWVWEQMVARGGDRVLAVGRVEGLRHGGALRALRALEAVLGDGVRVGSWEALGPAMRELAMVRVLPLTIAVVIGVAVTMGWAFRSAMLAGVGLAALGFAGLALMSVMRLAGWSWNLMNFLAIPLLLGMGVDYAIHLILALKRHDGDLRAVRRGTGRALWLCGATTMAGFGSLAWSSNAGLASLGKVSATGIALMLLVVQWIVPSWYALLRPGGTASPTIGPSRLYRAGFWSIGLLMARVVPPRLLRWLAEWACAVYAVMSPRKPVVERNLEPVLGDDSGRAAHRLFRAFGRKLVDLWRHEAGRTVAFRELRGRELLERAASHGRGVLLVTIHLGNWEIGTTVLKPFTGDRLMVLTQDEPGAGFTAAREAARKAQGVETVAVGTNGFGFVDVMRRLKEGGWVAALIDRPPAGTEVMTTFFGRPFAVSRAPAELARATGCEVVPTIVVEMGDGYRAEVLPPVPYDREALRSPDERARFSGEILRVFEPFVRQHGTQWFHFVDVWHGGSVRS